MLVPGWERGVIKVLDQDIAIHEDDLKSLWDSPLRVKSRVFNFSENDPEFYLLFTPDWRFSYHKQTRFTWQGHLSKSEVDECSFIDPYIDLFSFQRGNRTTSNFRTPRDFPKFKKKDFYPLVICNLSGTKMQCPRSVKPLLSSLYGTLKPNTIIGFKRSFKSNMVKNKTVLLLVLPKNYHCFIHRSFNSIILLK